LLDAIRLPEKFSHLVRRFLLSNQFVATTIALAAVVAVASLTPPPAIAQPGGWVTDSICPDNTPAEFHRCALEASKTFDPLHIPDGGPDLSGVWRLRAPGLYEDLEEHPETPDDQGGPGAIVDPPDGKVPMHAWADERRRESADRYIHHNAACFLSGVPETMYMAGTFQFLQTPDDFVILSEDAHAYRSIPLDGHAPVGENIRLWNGDSRGHWEGNTLVIETTNQNGKPWLDQRARFYTEEAYVVERLTLVDADTLHYEATIDDPNVYTQPFTIVLAYRRSTVEGFEIMAMACYENNAALMDLYRGVGYGTYPGISAAEAREALEAGR
jgi:hypothetical protein